MADLTDWRMWLIATVLAAILTILIGPIPVPQLLTFIIRANGKELFIDGWTEFVLLLVVIRILFGTEAALKVLEKILEKI